ncbi:MAG: small conductance mechanosensitive channel [Fusobacteria bacterium]|nr:MAG: small conductance mechanosensitive channel [Fusobacteriota bacterium]KAF0229123.1 MAG: small conductance mechanosensitive [Fusobacteriota bacterium]
MNTIRELIIDNANQIIKFIAIAVIGYIVIKVIMLIFNKSKSIVKIDPNVGSFLKGLIKFMLYAVYIIMLLTLLGIPITTFVAMLGAVGLAIALALQGNLSNFASAILILMFKPFVVGDYIGCKGDSGSVRDIQLLFTTIITPDNKKVTIPNSDLINSSVINYTSEDTRRVDLIFSAGYDSDVGMVKSILMDVVANHQKILMNPEPIIRLAKHTDNALDYDVKVWVNTFDYWDVFYDLEENVRTEFEKNHIQIPFPQREIVIRQMPE